MLNLSRNIFFYNRIYLPDKFETRLYLMFMHFSIIMIIYKKKGKKFNQNDYDSFFNNIEYNLRETGFGDVTVNKKMKDFNKILYDILLKIENSNEKKFSINKKLIVKYFDIFEKNNQKYKDFEEYFINFFNFCFELPLDSMIEEAIKFK